jgi:hypothetical protein
MFLRALRLARATVEIPGLTAAGPRPRGPVRWAAGPAGSRARVGGAGRAGGRAGRCSSGVPGRDLRL